jgi:hypothetical protein
MIRGPSGEGLGGSVIRSRAHAWTDDETATLVRLVGARHSDVEIGRHLGLSAAAVGRKRRALGFTAGVPPRLRIVVARTLAAAVEDTTKRGGCR